MFDEPYRWVEAISNRREYIEDQLRLGNPVVGLSYDDGALLLTVTTGQRKLFEIHDTIAFSALGHPADIERLRIVAIDQAHVEGFTRSADDVSSHRLVNFIIAPIIKQAFDEIFRSPYIAKIFIAELESIDKNVQFYSINYDGSFQSGGGFKALAGTEGAESDMSRFLSDISTDKLSLGDALDGALRAWALGRIKSLSTDESAEDSSDSKDVDIEEFLRKEFQNGSLEAAVLERSTPRESKFRFLSKEEVEPLESKYARSNQTANSRE